VAFAGGGKRLLSGSLDGSALVWDATCLVAGARVPGSELSAGELEALWGKLAGADAAAAYQAVMTLAAHAARSVPFLDERLRVADAPAARLIEDLRSDSVAVRRRAAAGLERLGPRAEPGLRRALGGGPPLDFRQRVEHLLAGMAGPVTSPQLLQALRAL